MNLDQIYQISQNRASLKAPESYISDQANFELAQAFNTENLIDSQARIIELSNQEVSSKVNFYVAKDERLFRSSLVVVNSFKEKVMKQVNELNQKLEGMNPYVIYAGKNKDVEEMDEKMAWGAATLFFVLFLLTVFTEMALAKFYLELTLDGEVLDEGEVSFFGNIGGLVYLIGLLPGLVMSMGFFAKEHLLSLRSIIKLEIVWMVMYASTLLMFGTETVADLLTVSLLPPQSDLASITGVIMVVTQAILLTAVGHYFTNKCSHYLKSTRIEKVSDNPIYKKTHEQLASLQTDLERADAIITELESNVAEIETYKDTVLALNDVSINKAIQTLSSIDEKIVLLKQDLKVSIDDIDEAYRKRDNLHALLDDLQMKKAGKTVQFKENVTLN